MSEIKLDASGLTTPSIVLGDNVLTSEENKLIWNGEEFKSGGNHNVGEQWISMDGTIPFGGLAFLGQTVSKETYIELYDWVETNGRFKTEAEWQTLYSSNNGNVSFYAKVDDNTFRLPSFKGYLKANTTAGGYTKEGLPNITGSARAYYWDDINQRQQGAILQWTDNNKALNGGATDGFRHGTINFEASRSSSIYGNSTHVTPETNTILIGVYAINTIINPSEIDMENIRTDLENINSKFSQGVIPHASASIGAKGTKTGYLNIVRATHSINGTPMDGHILSSYVSDDWHSQFLISNGGDGGLYYRNNNNGTQNGWQQLNIIKSSWKNGGNWYRIYADGWIEQGGSFSFSEQVGTITLHKAFLDTNYFAVASPMTGGSGANFNAALYSKTTTNFVFNSMIAKACSGFWYACGY